MTFWGSDPSHPTVGAGLRALLRDMGQGRAGHGVGLCAVSASLVELPGACVKQDPEAHRGLVAALGKDTVCGISAWRLPWPCGMQDAQQK